MKRAFNIVVLLCFSAVLTFAQGKPTTAPASPTGTTKKTIQRAQESLQARGYQPGSADGVMGTKAIAALKKFQSDRGLTITGQLDSKTLEALSTPPAKAAQKPGGEEPLIPAASIYVPVKAKCVVYHSGYEGIVVAPGVSEPTGKISKFECNGKDVEIASPEMAKGIIVTKAFGKVRVHFGSMIATIGAGDFTAVPDGHTIPEQTVEVAVQKSTVESFKSQFP